ncbi:PREDICTED: PRAME family member 8-like [Myotis davidii]|uniref:PRAME family member 8-like n=1 Tax=Myotis davidii TaxID=225400 RepID=UPI0007676F49|nr:PREDICTED: PRAME family member 8-like [Myotis davidii]
MSIRTPPTLLELAGRSLPRDQASAIAALEYLPAELFPLLFIQTYYRRMQKPLKALVHAWPFTVLPLGSLLRLPPFMEEQQYFSQFLSQMLRLRHLKKLYLESPSFLRDCLDQMLRCLQTPLDKLSIWLCWQLTHSDLTHLFQCPNLRQLKSLRLYAANLTNFSPEPLRALLEAVTPTLQDLRLDNCGMVDSQVEAILPVLSCCHQLRGFTISENHLSVATVKKLLRHTAWLCRLELQLYPIPLECYRTQETVGQERVALIRAELMETLRELGQPRTIHLDTKYFSSREFYLVAFS